MNITIKQISSLHKVQLDSDLNYPEITSVEVLRGERYSYQIAFRGNWMCAAKFEVKGELEPYTRLYKVNQSPYDAVVTDMAGFTDPDYLSHTTGLMPDLLTPLDFNEEDTTAAMNVQLLASSVRIEVNIPRDMKPGAYKLTVSIFNGNNANSELLAKKTMRFTVIDEEIKEQSLIYTRWFYADCISDYHGVEIYSDRHFELIEGYLREAVDCGINMILVPIHTPPLDTKIGTYRPCVQLVDIEKRGEEYIFTFDNFDRFINICKRVGVKYYEMAHMFSQWGAKCAAPIQVTVDGKKDYMFGWHVSSTDPAYIEFLKQYIKAVSDRLAYHGVQDYTYFHISDEPSLEGIEAYKRAAEIIRPLIGKARTMDALSNYAFYEQGLVECPVTCVNHIKEFLEHKIDNQWAYYCCGPQYGFINSFIGTPGWRLRILGLLLYKYDIKGFLHWGMNFYNNSLSRSNINPYVTTSGNGCWPSGDPFIFYPAKNGSYPSIRAKVTAEAIGDMDLCRTLEEYIGREAVIRIIDRLAGKPLRFDDFPKGEEYIFAVRKKLISALKAAKI